MLKLACRTSFIQSFSLAFFSARRPASLGAGRCGTRTAAAAAGELDTTSARARPPFGDAFGDDALRAPGLRLPADSGAAAAAAATASASGEGGGEGEREPAPPEPPPLLSARVSAAEVGGDIRTPA